MDITETLYLSGRMTNQPGFNFRQFDSAAAALRAQGYEVISPAEHDREVVARLYREGHIAYRRPEDVPGYENGDVVKYQEHAGSVHDLLAWDFLQIIQESDGIAMMPGWEHSSGARAERLVAEAVGKHVYLVTNSLSTDWVIASDIEQRRLHDHVSLFAASAIESTAPSPTPLVPLRPFHELLERTVLEREATIDAEHEAILRSISDDFGKPLPPHEWVPCGVCRNEEEHIRVTGLPEPTVPVDSFEQLPLNGEVRVVDPNTGGAKGQKPQAMHLLPGDSLLAISEHLHRGALKYAERNWELGYAWSSSFAAMQRHLWAWWQGEDDDPEFGWSHLRAVGFHALVLLAFELRGSGTDDRPNTGCGPCCGDGNHTPEQPAERTARWEASDLR